MIVNLFKLIKISVVPRNTGLFFLFSILWTLTSCGQDSSSGRVRQLSLHFKEEHVIGNNKSKPEDFFFMSPSQLGMVRTDHSGNIYVSDYQSNDIKVFDPDGNFLRNIGKKGKGPAEFTNISAIDINRRNELVVLDYSNDRVTWFSDSGKLLSSRIPPKRTMVWPNSFIQLDNGDYLLLKKLRDIQYGGNQKQQYFHSCVFHLYDRNFHYVTSFGDIDSLMDARDARSDFVRLYLNSFNPGHFCPAGKGEIWYAPGIYEGRIFKFREGPHGWRVDKTIRGHIMAQHPVDLDTNSPGTLSIGVYGGNKPNHVSGRINSVDLGLFVLKDGRLINFSLQRQNGAKMVMMAEVFSPKGKLEGFGKLKAFSFPGTYKTFMMGSLKDVLWKDPKDRFYFIDRRDTTPVIRIGRIKGM